MVYDGAATQEARIIRAGPDSENETKRDNATIILNIFEYHVSGLDNFGLQCRGEIVKTLQR